MVGQLWRPGLLANFYLPTNVLVVQIGMGVSLVWDGAYVGARSL
jgi:hypothetical protein